jgi:hypothetical protein
VTGWELDGPELDAQGDLANAGARCPECSCPLDEHDPDGGHAFDCLALNCRDRVGRVIVPGIPPCRVRACPWPSVRAEHCVEHDTPEVRGMARPHLYVFEGRRIALESRPWESWAAASTTAHLGCPIALIGILPNETHGPDLVPPPLGSRMPDRRR